MCFPLQLVFRDDCSTALVAACAVIDGFECGGRPKVTVMCEPCLGKRNLYPTISKVGNYENLRTRLDILAYADGELSIFDLAVQIAQPLVEVINECRTLHQAGLIKFE